MDRLLRRDGELIERVCHYGHEERCFGCADKTKCNADIFERLAHYEDLEMTPEEIQQTLENFSALLCEVTGNRMSKTNYTVKAMVSEVYDYFERSCDDCYERKEYARYKDLEEQGRLVELPVAVGANIYNIFIPDIGRMHDGSIVQGIPIITTEVFNWDNIGYVRKLWGKRVFATKQEAVSELERCGYADYYDFCDNEFEKPPSSEAAIAAGGMRG